MAVIGIDFGTRFSAAARCVNGRPEVIPLDGKPTLPSVVSLLKSGEIAIGWTAKRNQANAPQNTIIEVKRKMGKDVQVQLGEKTFSPQEISAMILTRIKELAEDQLGEPITGAVISCPAYFTYPARAAIQQAGELAGLNILGIINEPTAAAYAYGVLQGDEDKERLYVVYDLGGGTFDVTVIKMVAGLLEVIGTGGDPELGGGNFDDRIVKWMFQKIEEKNPEYMATLTDDKRAAVKLRLKTHAEEGKIKLCDTPEDDASYQFLIPAVDVFQGRPIPFNETLTRSMFEKMIEDLLKNSMKWIDEALRVPKEKYGYKEIDLTAILLVGGSTRIPLVRKMLEDWCKEKKTKTPLWGHERGINPDEIVALGASIAAAEKDPDSEALSTGVVLIDVTGHTLSVAALNEHGILGLQPIIPKETQIPCAGEHEFSSLGNFQERCRIEVFQGEGTRIDPEKVTMIGAFDIEIAPIARRTPLKVDLELNENGILVAHATDKLSGQRVSCRMDYKNSPQMSPEDLAKKKALLFESAIEVSMNLAEQSKFDEARRLICCLTDQPKELLELKQTMLSQIDEAEHQYKVRTGSDTSRPLCGSPNMPGGQIDHVRFSITSPTVMARGRSHLLDVWAHMEKQRSQLIQRAQEQAGGRERIIVGGKGPIAVERGTVLTVTLQVQGFIVDPLQDTICWEGEIGNAQFSITVPCDATEGLHQGIARISVDGIPLIKFFFEICVGTLNEDSFQLPLRERRYRKVFASYAFEDRAIVLGRIHGMLKVMPDLDIFADVLSLRSGEHWQKRLRNEIRARDALYLFWSLAASRSKWVDWEWRCALKERGIDFIDPVPLPSDKDVPPPEELAQLCFHDPINEFIRSSGESRTTG